jgi:hypothetical protein
MSLGKDEILGADHKWPVEKVSVPEWGEDGHVFVRTVSAHDLMRIHANLPGEDAGADEAMRGNAMLCALFVCDEQGEPLFEATDADKLLQLPAPELPALIRVAEAGLRLNKIGGDEQDDLAGNSESIPPDDSPSG